MNIFHTEFISLFIPVNSFVIHQFFKNKSNINKLQLQFVKGVEFCTILIQRKVLLWRVFTSRLSRCHKPGGLQTVWQSTTVTITFSSCNATPTGKLGSAATNL